MLKMGSLLWHWTSHQNNLQIWTWITMTLIDWLRSTPRLTHSPVWLLRSIGSKRQAFSGFMPEFCFMAFSGSRGLVWWNVVDLLGHHRLTAAAMVWKQKLYKQTSIWDQEWKGSKLKWKRHGSFLSHVWALLSFIYQHLGPHWQILRRRSLRWEKILIFFSANEKKGWVSILK